MRKHLRLAVGAAAALAIGAFFGSPDTEPAPAAARPSLAMSAAAAAPRTSLGELHREPVPAPVGEIGAAFAVARPLDASASLVVSGDAASLGVLAELRQDYAALAAIVSCSDTPAAALAKVADGSADAAILCSTAAPHLPPGLTLRSLGTFVAALTTSPWNSVRDVPRTELGALLGGQLRDWRRLGGGDDSLRLMCSQGRPYRPLRLRNTAKEGRSRFRGEAALLAKVAVDANALGVVELRSLGGERVAVMTIDGVPPSRLAFESGEYPLGYRLYLVHSVRPRPCLDAFLRYLASDRGHALLRRQIEP